MKYAIALMVGLIVSLGSIDAQIPKGLKGPAAKNYKPWKDQDRVTATVVSQADKEQLQGPAAKNYKPWKDEESTGTTVEVVSSKPKLKGPAAKNHKPWKD